MTRRHPTVKFNAASFVCLQIAGRTLLTLVSRPLQEIWAGLLAASRGFLCPVRTLGDPRGPKLLLQREVGGWGVGGCLLMVSQLLLSSPSLEPSDGNLVFSHEYTHSFISF